MSYENFNGKKLKWGKKHEHENQNGFADLDLDSGSSNSDDETKSNASKISLMNEPGIGRAYVPTKQEQLLNLLTHGVFVLPSIFSLVHLLNQAKDEYEYIVCLVYGLCGVVLFTSSTVFHIVGYINKFSVLKNILHRVDRAMIYIFIAASYTPWLALREMVPSDLNTYLLWFTWGLSTTGILYQQLFHEKYKGFETTLYVIMGTLPSVAIVNMKNRDGINELIFGGFVFLTGLYFFKSDGYIPFAHAIWHVFVAIGASIIYFATDKHLIQGRKLAEAYYDKKRIISSHYDSF